MEPIKVGTLSGIAEYLKQNRDQLELTRIVVHVSSPSSVYVKGAIEAEDKRYRRAVYMNASLGLFSEQPKFGQFVDVETMIIGLQAGFVGIDDRARVLDLISSIRENSVRDTVDSGYAQTVTTSGGVIIVGEQRVPNPVLLRPYRTFREVVQPASQFILRLRNNERGERPLVALFEGDGGAWKLEAIQNIVEWLETRLEDIPVIA